MAKAKAKTKEQTPGDLAACSIAGKMRPQPVHMGDKGFMDTSLPKVYGKRKGSMHDNIVGTPTMEANGAHMGGKGFMDTSERAEPGRELYGGDGCERHGHGSKGVMAAPWMMATSADTGGKGFMDMPWMETNGPHMGGQSFRDMPWQIANSKGMGGKGFMDTLDGGEWTSHVRQRFHG